MEAVADVEFVMIRDGRYRLYKDGRVYSVEKGRLLTVFKCGDRKNVSLLKDGSSRNVSLANLVYRAFVDDVDPATQLFVHHKDGNPDNCHADNLYRPGGIEAETLQRNMLQYPRPGHVQAHAPYRRYVVSWDGFVYNAMINVRILGTASPDGYMAFSARRDLRGSDPMLMHRFVYWCFYPEFDIRDQSRIIYHIDEDRKNNNVSNLREICSKECAQSRKARPVDGKYHRAVEVIRDGEVIDTLQSVTLARQKYYLSPKQISASVRRLRVVNGLTFRFLFEDFPNETWVRIIHCELPEWAPAGVSDLVGVYVSSLGRIMGPSGALSVSSAEGMVNRKIFLSGRKSTRAHQVICYAFHGIPGKDQTVDHINMNHQDNRAVNLRWADPEIQVSNKKAVKAVVHECTTTGKRTTFLTKVKAALFAGVKSGETIGKYCDSGEVLAGGTWSYAPEAPQGVADNRVLTGDPSTSVPVPYEHARLICQHGGAAILGRVGIKAGE